MITVIPSKIKIYILFMEYATFMLDVMEELHHLKFF